MKLFSFSFHCYFKPFFLLNLFLGIIWTCNFALADCIWYGVCGNHPNPPGEGTKSLNCAYKGPAKPATPAILQVLQKYCPNYFNTEPNQQSILTCCSEDQMVKFGDGVGIAFPLLQKCPSCQHNFMQIFCEFTCRPNQNSFMEVKNVITTSEGKEGISEINVYVNKTYTSSIFQSCKNLFDPLSTSYIMDLLCNRPVISCNAEIWFQFLGDINYYSPLQINFIHTDSKIGNFIPLSVKTYNCDEKPQENAKACSCLDCPASCPRAAEIKPFKKYYIGPLLVSQFFIIIGYFFGLLIIIPLLIIHSRRERMQAATGVMVSDWFANFFTAMRSKCKKLEILGASMEGTMEKSYSVLGKRCVKNRWIIIILVFVIFIATSIGILFIKITTDPIELWANPESKTRLHKTYFDTHFSPFYRTEQIIIEAVNLDYFYYNDSGTMTKFGPVFQPVFLKSVHDLQESIKKITVDGITLSNLCVAPLSQQSTAKEISECAVESVWGYFQDNATRLQDETDPYLKHLLVCMNNPLQIICLASWGGPVLPALVYGNFLKAGLNDYGTPKYEQASVVILTYLLKNYENKTLQEPAKKWEAALLQLLKTWPIGDKMNMSYSTERSIEDELNRTSGADVFTILISYLAMFIYIIIFLGSYTTVKNFLVDSRITLGFFGLVLVLMSVSSSAGIFGYLQEPATPVIIEVIPFLVLAIGVDNIFIIVHSYDRMEDVPGESVEERMGRMLGLIGPSITLTSVSECCCFFVGALSNMPAVRAFALYAGIALLIDFIFQITCFISLLALDSRRSRARRFDVICCFKSSAERTRSHSFILICFKKFYVPCIMNKYSRPIIIIFFYSLFFLSLLNLPVLPLGLNQELSMSKDSYLYKYFTSLKEYLSIGPPVYFVVKDSKLDYSEYKIQNLFCNSPNCDLDSLTYQIYGMSKASNITYIATPSSSWIDDYFGWTCTDYCCKMYENKTFCPHQYDCDECTKVEQDVCNRPTKKDFKRYISFFLKDNPDEDCVKGGHPSYEAAVKLKNDGIDDEGFIKHKVGANYYMAYHSILKTSEDYYNALYNALTVSKNITKTVNIKIKNMGYDEKIEVFPYSVFYVFYEQYLTLRKDAFKGISLSFCAIFITTFILLGLDFWSAFLVVVTIGMIIIDIAGMMYWWDIELNAISLVNLVLAVGISVEFCSHIIHSFIKTIGDNRIDRASKSLTEMGSSVFAGITLTKLIGITVLAFAQSQIFQIFYFRKYLLIVIFGAAHGLIFLPVFLSYLGSDTHSYYLNKYATQTLKPEDEIDVNRETNLDENKDKNINESKSENTPAATNKDVDLNENKDKNIDESRAEDNANLDENKDRNIDEPRSEDKKADLDENKKNK